MATLNIRNVPENLYEKLKKSAKSHHRSLNQETIAALEQALYGESIGKEDILRSARQLREKTKKYHLTDSKLLEIKNKDRE